MANRDDIDPEDVPPVEAWPPSQSVDDEAFRRVDEPMMTWSDMTAGGFRQGFIAGFASGAATGALAAALVALCVGWALGAFS